MSGLFTTVMSCFLRTRVRGSVTPLMYGREANDLRDSDPSTILKNVPTSSSGDNTVERRVLLLRERAQWFRKSLLQEKKLSLL